MAFDYAAHKPLLCDSTGRRLTTGLFEELAVPSSATKPVFKLAEWHLRYVEIADPTDYKAAMELIGDWDHWCALVANPVFKSHLEEWRKEVVVKLKSEAITELRKRAKTENGTAAAKYLAEMGNEKKKTVPRASGRDKAAEESRISADAARIGLKAVK